jgi:hypothetical protein
MCGLLSGRRHLRDTGQKTATAMAESVMQMVPANADSSCPSVDPGQLPWFRLSVDSDPSGGKRGVTPESFVRLIPHFPRP